MTAPPRNHPRGRHARSTVAAEVVGLLSDHLSGPVQVVGAGSLARLVRKRLGERAWTDGARPAVVVDTTGSPENIVDALRRLDDGGTLVLTHGLGARPVPLDLYSDVHLRCLTIVGVGPPQARRSVPLRAVAVGLLGLSLLGVLLRYGWAF
jgi:hypothetical protein